MGCTSSSPTVEEKKTNVSSSTKKEALVDGAASAATTTKENVATNIAIQKASSFNSDKENVVETPTSVCVIGADSNDTIALKVRYACLSRRGRDPDDPTKENQDCYSAHVPRPENDTTENLFQTTGGAFFGVYDGHGPHGRDCSHFVRKRLPALIDRNLTFDSDHVKDALHEAHLECNMDLRASDIQDSHSGTTSISVYIHSRAGDASTGQHKITVCNVGDSRAILGTTMAEQDSNSCRPTFRLQAVPLSNDQTPKRADEAARCVRSGARILSFGQIDPSRGDDDDDGDDTEDPPRVWSKQGLYPGTAFTRSHGDAVAERLGVFAEPEQLTMILQASIKVIVLASDGIFDMMSNQDVVDVCGRCYHRNDPLQACQTIVAKSHAEWLLNEDCGEDSGAASYDDMTVMCLFIDDGHEVTTEEAAEGTVSANKGTPPGPNKRVRQKTLRNLEELVLSSH